MCSSSVWEDGRGSKTGEGPRDTKDTVMIHPRRSRKSLSESCGDGAGGYEIDLEGFLKVKEWRT